MIDFILSLGPILFFMHWPITIPTAVAAFFIGSKVPHAYGVWLLLVLGFACVFLMPYAPGAAQGSEGMIYMTLPIIVPFFVLLPYAIGLLARPKTEKLQK